MRAFSAQQLQKRLKQAKESYIKQALVVFKSLFRQFESLSVLVSLLLGAKFPEFGAYSCSSCATEPNTEAIGY